MGLLSGPLEFLFGAAPTTSEAMSKEDIAWLMDQGLTANRTDKQGLFGGWGWTQGPDGRWMQTETVNEALIPGIEKLMGSISGDQKPYESPEQFSVMLDAMMGNKLESLGQDPGGYKPSYSPYQPVERMPYSPPEQPQQHAGSSGYGRGAGGPGGIDPRYGRRIY